MSTNRILAKLVAIALLITAALVYTASRSGASSIDSIGLSPRAEQTDGAPDVPGMPDPVGAPELRGYHPVPAERLPLSIHGPFVQANESLSRTRRMRPRESDPNDDDDNPDGDKDKDDAPCTNPAKCGGPAGGDGPQKIPQTPLTDITWDGVMTPQGGFDPQIAAGPSYLLMTMRDQLVFLDKAGKVLSQDKNGKPFNGGPINTNDFFGGLTDDINAHLNLPPVSPASQGYGIDTYYDARAIYDSYRQRYWIVALAINNKTPCFQQKQAGAAQCNPFLSGARRGKVVVGVSSSSDPRDKWFLYWWDAIPHDGDCGIDVICRQTEHGADYPSLGISEKYLIEEHGAGTKTDSYRYVSVAPADELAKGAICNNCNYPNAWAFWHIKNPDGSLVNMLQPAVHHGPTLPNCAFFAGNYQSLGQSYHISMYFFDVTGQLFDSTSLIKTYAAPDNAPQPPSPPGIVQPYQLKISNVGNGVMKAAFRGGKLYSTFQDCKIWPGASKCVTSIRVVRVDITNPGSPEIDRTFGQRNVLDPANVKLVSYGTPAVEVNKHGNIALVYMRSGTNVFPEARYSVYSANAPDISPSQVLRMGASSYGGDSTACGKSCARGNLDVGGISVDGADDEAVWLAHGYVDNKGQMKIAVGKIFGKGK